jgi:uncharacterized protein
MTMMVYPMRKESITIKTLKTTIKMHLFRKLSHLLALFCIGTGTLYSQAPKESVLYKITGNGIKSTSYILGTIHVYCDSALKNNTVLGKCVGSTEYFVSEINLGDYDELVAMMKASMMPNKVKISELTTAKEYALIDSICQAFLDVSIKDMDSKSPMNLMAALFTSNSILGCSEIQSVEAQVLPMALGSGLQTFGLETFTFQDSLLKSIPDSIQIQWLLEFCRNPEAAKKEMNQMQTLYKMGKMNELYRLVTNSNEMKLYKKALIDDRNVEWVNFLKDNLSNVSIFMAVGIGHLGGENGVLNGLKRAGYTVTPVKI